MFGSGQRTHVRLDRGVTAPHVGDSTFRRGDRTNASFNFHVEDRSDHSPTWGPEVRLRPRAHELRLDRAVSGPHVGTSTSSARTSFDSIAASPVPHVGDSMFRRGDRTKTSFNSHVKDRSGPLPTWGTRCSAPASAHRDSTRSRRHPSPTWGTRRSVAVTARTRASIPTWKIGQTTPPRGGLDVPSR